MVGGRSPPAEPPEEVGPRGRRAGGAAGPPPGAERDAEKGEGEGRGGAGASPSAPSAGWKRVKAAQHVHSRLRNTYAAAHSRRYGLLDGLSSAVEDNEFQLGVFLRSFLYELLPMWAGAVPILLLERSGGFNIALHRMFVWLPGFDKEEGVRDGFTRSFFVSLNTWSPWILLALWLDDDAVSGILDTWTLGTIFALLFMRGLCIGTKYGYYEKRDLKLERGPFPAWSQKELGRRLVAGGWGNVRGNEGLMQELLESAMTNTDINLKALSLRVDESSRLEEAFRKSGNPYVGDDAGEEDGKLSAAALAYQIAWTTLARDMPMLFGGMAMAAGIVTGSLPSIVRSQTGKPPFGATHAQKTACAFEWICLAQLTFINFVYIMSAVHDFSRRLKTMEALGDLVNFTGIEVGAILEEVPPEKAGAPAEAGTLAEKADAPGSPPAVPGQAWPAGEGARDLTELKLRISLRSSHDAFTWYLMRQCLRKVGSSFFNRLQLYMTYYL